MTWKSLQTKRRKKVAPKAKAVVAQGNGPSEWARAVRPAYDTHGDLIALLRKDPESPVIHSAHALRRYFADRGVRAEDLALTHEIWRRYLYWAARHGTAGPVAEK